MIQNFHKLVAKYNSLYSLYGKKYGLNTKKIKKIYKQHFAAYFVKFMLDNLKTKDQKKKMVNLINSGKEKQLINFAKKSINGFEKKFESALIIEIMSLSKNII